MCMWVRLVAVCGNLIFHQTARSSERFRARSRRSLPPSATPTVSLADRITSQPFHPRLPYVSCHHAVMVTALLCTAQPEKRYRSHAHARLSLRGRSCCAMSDCPTDRLLDWLTNRCKEPPLEDHFHQRNQPRHRYVHHNSHTPCLLLLRLRGSSQRAGEALLVRTSSSPPPQQLSKMDSSSDSSSETTKLIGLALTMLL
jgi:hypothetical protein